MAHVAGDGRRAAAAVHQALAALDGAEAPLAAWRVYATAARVCPASPDVAAHRAASAAVLDRLAAALSDAAPLRTGFLAHPTVEEVRSRAAP